MNIVCFQECDQFFPFIRAEYRVYRCILINLCYAGINLTGYHPPAGTMGLLHRNVRPAPGLLHNRQRPGAGPVAQVVPGAGHLHQPAFKHENC